MCGMDNTAPHDCVENWKWTEPLAGKRGMVRAGGSASRTIDDSDAPDPGGGHHPAWKQPKDGTQRPRWTPNAQPGFPVLGSLTPAEEKRRDRAIPDSGTGVVEWNLTLESISHSEWDGGHRAPLGCNAGVPRRGMRPAGISGPARRMAPVGVRDVKGRSDRTASVGRGGGVLSYTGPGKECNIWTEDDVQRIQSWSCPGGSCSISLFATAAGVTFSAVARGSCIGLCD